VPLLEKSRYFYSMARYFLELSYHGKAFSGFQIQQNAVTVQGELEKAMAIYYRAPITLTGSSRTDAGVHALQNFFHFDTTVIISEKDIYHLNALIGEAISIRNLFSVDEESHCRFDALSREYKYYITKKKDPFLTDRAWFYPYSLDIDTLNEAALALIGEHDFTAFAKRNTQVFTHQCTIESSYWQSIDNTLIYTVKANRFLRGMVRAMVATMLKTAKKNIDMEQFKSLLANNTNILADFSAPAHGLFLCEVAYKDNSLKLITA
jgi:tRNA pseudouridine38-40 synthase